MLKKKDILNLITTHFEYLAQTYLPVGSIEPLQNPQKSLSFKVSYGQPNVKELDFYPTSHYFTFDPAKNPSIEKFPSFPITEIDVQVEAISSTGTQRALIRKKQDKVTLEIWGKNKLIQSIRISELHGNLYTDAQFTLKPLVWSKNEKRILYVAEKKEAKIPKFFDKISNEEDAEKILENYFYKQDLGEGYNKKYSPTLFLYDIEDHNLYQVENVSEDIIPTYVSFADNEGTKIILCGFHLGSIRQGLKFALNRDSKIYYIDKLSLKSIWKSQDKNDSKPKEEKREKAEILKLTQDFASVFPILDPSLTKLIYFFSPQKYTHAMGLGVKLINLQKNKSSGDFDQELLLDIVKENNADFVGVMGYHDRLHKTNWLSDSKHVVFNSDIRGAIGLYILNTETKEVKRIDTPLYRSEEWRLKNVHQNLIFASISNLVGHSKIGIFEGFDPSARNLEEAVRKGKWHFFDLAEEEKTNIPSELELNYNGEIEEKVIEIEGVESLFFSVKDFKDQNGKIIPKSKRPLMIALHGGPHGLATGMFGAQRHYALFRGYNILYPNFSGSTGFGQDFLERLPGKIGELDVEEIKKVIDYCIEKQLGDPNQLIVTGGSYGGYLGAVLIAKFPDLFKCAILKNPVLNIPLTYETSDIPEWAYCEVFNKDINHEPTSEELKELYEFSPVCMNKDIKSSILLVVGGNDRRVPCGGAIQYYKMMKRRGIDIEMAFYPNDEHGLSSSPEAEIDQFVKNYWFIEEKLGKDRKQ